MTKIESIMKNLDDIETNVGRIQQTLEKINGVHKHRKANDSG